MFIEPQYGNREGTHRPPAGWVEVICGSMFSGKTEELIRRLNRAKIANRQVEIFKPTVDSRYHDSDVVSHEGRAIRSTPVDFANDIYLLANRSDTVGIDEAQFFDDSLIDVVSRLANDGKRVIIAGLDMDYTGNPFGPMPKLMSIAEFVTKVHAICVKCGQIATYSYRVTKSEELVQLGETEAYEARCRACFIAGKNLD